MEYKHFSHEHILTLYNFQSGQHFECHGCGLPCHNDSIFACWNCNFFLHKHCGNANRYVKHPSHGSHPLVLVPTPTYCSGSFLCDGSGRPGSSFSYCCPLCEVDLHVPCAYLPPKVTHKNHPHELLISFRGLSDDQGSPHFCNICSKQLGSKHWYYFCDKPECDFRVHTFCATTEVKPGIYLDDEPHQEPVKILVYPGEPPSTNQEETEPEEDILSAMSKIQFQMQMQTITHQLINSIINSAKL